MIVMTINCHLTVQRHVTSRHITGPAACLVTSLQRVSGVGAVVEGLVPGRRPAGRQRRSFTAGRRPRETYGAALPPVMCEERRIK